MDEAAKIIILILVASCSTSVVTGRGVASGQNGGASSEDWDILVLTQFWPPAACLLMESEHKGCNISTGLTSWSIHGLWPTKTGTKGPNFCNDSLPFDLKILQVLEPRLEQNWPSVEKYAPADTLWSHEWVKHGTCATSLPALKDELHYFNGTLNLHDRFNVTQALRKGSITPSYSKAYKVEDVVKTLQEAIGSQPLITCVRDKTNSKCYIEQVELCLTKSFQPTDCSSSARATAGALLHATAGAGSLLFQSERAVGGKQESETCDCGSEDIYYKPMPSK